MHINKGSFFILERVDSTNNYAMQQVYAGKVNSGDCWFAIEQTHGKGRRGRQWASTKGENIVLSIAVAPFPLLIYEQFKLSAAVSLACYDLFKIYDSINTRIKWPNDLFWNDRKAGGMLIENVIKGNIWQWSVIGLGVNINQMVFALENNKAVSLKQITGKDFDPVSMAKELHNLVINRMNELASHDFNKMLDQYNAVLYKRHEKVRLKKQNMLFETTITGVSALGQLQTVDSLERSFNFDEIDWVL